MKQYVALLLVLSIPVLLSCKKGKNSKYSKTPVDSMELHLEGGFAGQSLHYVIAGNEVYRDTTTSYDETYNWTLKLPAEKYEKVKHIPSQIPQKLYGDGSRTYGSNDGTADFPVVWVVVKTPRGNYKWLFEYRSPGYAESFSNKVTEAIQMLGE